MDYIAPPLRFVGHVKRSIEMGASLRSGVLAFVQENRSEFAKDVSKWISLMDQGLETLPILQKQRSQYRRSVLELVERGLRGESIYQYLCQLEHEIVEACEDEMSRKLSKLPFLLLGPLLLMQFPAFLLLLFGPLLENFFHSLGGG